MLQELNIQNLALIEKLQLNFKTGFTSLTGETGAGKSILLDALGLTLGNRADSGLVRHGTKRADVTASFDIRELSQVQTWLQENELDDEEDCLLRRTLTSEGRSKAYINGLPVSATQLKTLSGMLIDIHGQHEHQTLLNNQKQLELLDAYAQHASLTTQTRQNYQAWSKLNQTYQTLLDSQSDRQSKIELLSFQLEEFDELAPQIGEFESLSEEQNALSHANEIKTANQNAQDFLDGENGVAEQLNRAIAEMESVADYQPHLQPSLAQLNSLLIDAQEVATDLQHQNQQVELDPSRLQSLDERLSALFGLAKKYQIDPEALVEKHQSIQADLNTLTDSSESLEAFQEKIAAAWQNFETTATKLSQSRSKSAKKLSKTVTESMHTLGMANGLFDVSLSPADKASIHGLDKIELQVTANKGQPLQPLAKVASGGELSRISLAIQVASAEVASLPSLIFDEVDVGIGGGIAEVVGQKMQTLGQHRQIFSITHLAQVAAFGNQHLNIAKSTQDNQTTTKVFELSKPERIEELARMLGGMEITEQTLKHAEEMFELAQSQSA